MEISEYAALTKKRLLKPKSKTRPLPKAREAYIEAEEAFEHALNIFEIKYQKKFQIKTTKHWRFDFYIVKLNLLIEIVGSSWSVGRGGKKIANAFNKYELAENMGYTIERFEPHTVESGYVIRWIKSKLESLEYETKNI
ncbi:MULTISPECIES: hypothetical protein [Acinetobacter]|uniref:DUF559 domain-containing protein n=1 Tax=Acinetobacter piscicola TaxID=2006115 RepID=A0A7S6VXZ6_9GAMM|nr:MULTISPECIES: hypothetical protein [Acinetobacter]QOW46946.1 hypothetical protein G0028_14175 [Acinetobacter piscicola]